MTTSPTQIIFKEINQINDIYVLKRCAFLSVIVYIITQLTFFFNFLVCW